METLPKLTPVTRREPPPGYKAPVYTDPCYEEMVANNYPNHDECVAADAARYYAARQATERALLNYRWWGLTNIINTIRLWIQSVRYNRQYKKQLKRMKKNGS